MNAQPTTVDVCSVLGGSTLQQQVVFPILTYVDEQIAGAKRPLNETNQVLPLTGTLDFGNDYYTRTRKDPIDQYDIVNKKYADDLAISAGALKDRIQSDTGNNVVIAQTTQVAVRTAGVDKLVVGQTATSSTQKITYPVGTEIDDANMLVPKSYSDQILNNALIAQGVTNTIFSQDITALKNKDTAQDLINTQLQGLIETDAARITQNNNDYQNFKTVTVPNTYMKKIADSNLNMGQTHRITNLPPTAEPYDAISYFESNLRYMPKTTTLDAIPKPEANVDLNGVKLINSAALTNADIGMPGVPNRTLTTVDWVESRAGVYRDQANTYTDGRLFSQFITLDGKIGLVDSKKVNYTEGINALASASGDYSMGNNHIVNLPSATQPSHAVRYDQLTTVMDQTYTKTQTDLLIASRHSFEDGKANTDAIATLQTDKLSKSGGTMTGNLNMGTNNRLIQSYNPVLPHDVVNKEFLDSNLNLKTNVTTTDTLTNRVTDVENATVLNTNAIIASSNNLSQNYYLKTSVDSALNLKTDKQTTTTLQADVSALSGSLNTTNNNLSQNYNTKTQDLALFKPKDQIESKIEHASQLSAISCDSNRYISVKSNGNKICDILEDEVNQGFTLNTYNKRLNLVSQQPQTQYHNSSTGLFNYKFTGNNDTTTPGAANYGLLQIAPSNVTNLNPCINLISSRVNGFGTAGSLYLDSSYGDVQTPLIVAPQTLSDVNSTQMIQYRSTATPTLKSQFQGKTGYSATTAITETNQFTSKTYVDTADNLKVNKSGDTMTGALTLPGNPTSNLHAATKAYVDSQFASAGTGDFKKDGTVAMTGNLNMGTTNKIINLAAPTLTTDATNKTYVDTADALKLNLTGGTLTGALTLAADPSANLQASTKQYTDTQVATKISQTQGDARYLQLSGGTLTGDLTLSNNPTNNTHATTKAYVDSANALKVSKAGDTMTGALTLSGAPTSNLHAATKQYVDSAVSGAGSGSGISTSGGYAIQTSSNDIQTKKNGTTYQTDALNFGFLESIYSNAVNRRSHIMTDSSSINYVHGQYLVQNGAGRPMIQITDVGTEGTQCGRLSIWNRNSQNSGYENETFIQVKPTQSKIESSVPISYITEPGSFSGSQLVTKTHLDSAIAASTSGQSNKIVTATGTANPMTVQCNNGQVSVARSSGVPDQLQLTGNTISQVSGNSFQLQRGGVGLTLTDDGTTQNIGSNVPIIYSSSLNTATTDQLVSQRITDARYFKKTADSNLPMANFKVTGLADASATGEAVHFGQMLTLLRSLGFRRSGSISMFIGDLPLGNNVNIPSGNITGDAGFGAISAVHRVTVNANYFEIRIVHNFNTNLIRLFSEIYSVGNTGLSNFNDNGFNQWITNFSNLSTNEIVFWLCYEANVNDPSIQNNGYFIKLQEYV